MTLAMELSKDVALGEARSYWIKARQMSDNGRELLLAAILQRIYQQGVKAGFEDAMRIVAEETR